MKEITEKFIFNNKELVIKANFDYKTVKIGNEIFLPCREDLNYLINKLSDISEEMEDSNEV